MPAFLRENDPVRVGEIHLPDHLAGLVENLAVQRLTPLVELLELTRDDVRIVLARAHQKLDSANRVAEAADGVESGCENEPDAAARERLAFETGRFDQRAKTEVSSLAHHAKPVADEHPILSAQRRDVGNGGERDQIEHCPDEAVSFSQLLRQSKRKLECDADGGEILIGIPAARTAWIQDGDAIGKRAGGEMVVGDDYVDAHFAEARDRHDRARSAVARDDDLCTNSYGRICAGVAEVVTVFDATRDERRRLATESADGPYEQRGRADSVYVIVAVNENQFLRCDGTRETIDGAVEGEHRIRIVQPLQFRPEEELCGFRLDVSAGEQQAAEREREKERFSESSDR